MELKKLLEDEEYEYEDIDVYEGGEDVGAMCEKREVGIFITLLAEKIVNGSLNKGIRIVFDIEPLLYESAFNLYAIAVSCSKYWLTEENGVVMSSDGKPYRLSFSLFSKSQPGDDEILVVIMREKPEKFWDEFEDLVVTPRMVYLIVTRSRPEVNVSAGVMFRNLLHEVLKKTFLVMKEFGEEGWEEKIKYIGRVPYDVLLTLPLDTVKSIASTWTPPPPPNADYLYKRDRRLEELVLPPVVKDELKRFIELAEDEGRGSLLLVGLPASGRKTIAKSIGVELNLPVYHISVANILSRWVGESEAKLRAFFEGMRARGGVAVFENVEALFRKQTGENVTANLRSILYQEMARDDNNFIMIFTANEDASPELFDSPLLGETKLVIPPPNKEERRQLARMFLREISGRYWDKLKSIIVSKYRVSPEKAEEVLTSLYADPVAAASIGFTSGEIYRVMKRIVIPAIKKTVENGKITQISDDVIILSMRDYTARQARLRILLQRAILLGYTSIADSILEVEQEVRKKAIETAKLMEKYKV